MSQRIPQDFINNLVTRLDIVQVINTYIPLRKTGTNYVACCPFHHEKTPSFSVNQQKQFYHCFGCGVSGDVIQFIIEYKKVDFIEAVESLAQDLGLEIPKLNANNSDPDFDLIYTLLSDATEYFKQQLRQHKLGQQAVDYLKQRGLTGVVAKNFQLGFAPPGWENLVNSIAKDPERRRLGVKAGIFALSQESSKYYDRFRNRIMFPIHNRRGKVIGFGGRILGSQDDQPKYLNSPETILFNKSQELYGFYQARTFLQQTNSVIVVEGYMDVVSLAQAGIYNSVATLGTACTEQQVNILFKAVDSIIFCFDGDNAGKKAAWRALELCLPILDDTHRIKFLILPDKHDPDSYVRKFGKDAMLKELNMALSLPDYLVNTIASKYDLQHIDGQVAFANELKEHISKLPEGFLQKLLYNKLAQMIDLEPKNSAPKHTSSYSKEIFKSSQKIMVAQVPSTTRALALLLAERDLIKVLPSNFKELNNDEINGSQLFCNVASILLETPDASDDDIKKNLPEQLARNFHPIQLRGITHIIPKQGIEQEFLGHIALIQRRSRELVMEKLLEKAKSNVLSSEEKELLAKLLQEKAR